MKSRKIFTALLITLLLLIFLAATAPIVLAQELTPTVTATPSPAVTPTPTTIVADAPPVAPETLPSPTSTIVDIAVQFGALVGVAGLVAAIVNILKLTPLIKDGDTGPWYAGLSILAFAALVYFKIFRGVDISAVDKEAAQLSVILIFVTGYLVQLKAGQSWHDVLKLLKIPGISTSFSPPDGKTVNRYELPQ